MEHGVIVDKASEKYICCPLNRVLLSPLLNQNVSFANSSTSTSFIKHDYTSWPVEWEVLLNIFYSHWDLMVSAEIGSEEEHCIF
ncbi:hypothetical protein CEXT_609361 [Caerostris extrusa]|uniref:Uncharacterized protein n=1 Tax=Caerostris extrusa TaxID=172846 RepID=A0AAV4NJB2_CAEEX|nr:hypothetical protein CEXT_609361 [Caerostris extrusa]